MPRPLFPRLNKMAMINDRKEKKSMEMKTKKGKRGKDLKTMRKIERWI